MKYSSIILFLIMASLSSCNSNSSSKNSNSAQLGLDTANFSKTLDGKQIELYTLKNSNGIVVQITNFGGHIVSLFTPDKNGAFADIVQGYSTIDEYINDKMYQGGIIGRFGNRIAKGAFEINGKTYSLAINNGPNALHGGIEGYNKKVWDAEQTGNKIVLKYVSPDMEEGFPGELSMVVTYELTEDNELLMEYEATTSATTIVNLTNHTHFNLKGDADTTILDHSLQVFGGAITPVDSTLIPTGDLMDVTNTPFDFKTSKIIGKDIDADHQQIAFGLGYDHNWVLDKKPEELALGVKLSEATTGRIVELYTTEPGVQVYCGNFMDGTIKGKSGGVYKYRSGIALEPQHFPDSPNQVNFPSTILEPSEKYYQKSVLKFSVE